MGSRHTSFPLVIVEYFVGIALCLAQNNIHSYVMILGYDIEESVLNPLSPPWENFLQTSMLSSRNLLHMFGSQLLCNTLVLWSDFPSLQHCWQWCCTSVMTSCDSGSTSKCYKVQSSIQLQVPRCELVRGILPHFRQNFSCSCLFSALFGLNAVRSSWFMYFKRPEASWNFSTGASNCSDWTCRETLSM